jgi:hypothetical protein
VDPGAYPQRFRERPLLRSECDLEGDRSVNRIRGGRERRVRTVTCRLHEVTTVRDDRGAHQVVMPRQGHLHRVRVLLPQARRTVDVGEQEGDRPRRQL